MRLIDADKLLHRMESLRWHYARDTSPIECLQVKFGNEMLDNIENFIVTQPTAYDVDKVVEALETEKCIHTENFQISIYKDYPEIKQRYKQSLGIIDKAIKIVKAGGKE